MTSAVEPFTALNFSLFMRRCLLNFVARNSQLPNQRLIEDTGTATSYGAHCQFFMPGRPDLANQEDIEIRRQHLGDFKRYRNTAPRKRQHQRRDVGNQVPELFSENLTGFNTVMKEWVNQHSHPGLDNLR